MFLEQICPGQVNPLPHAVHTFVWQKGRYMAYCTGSKVVIYADPNTLVQVIFFSEQVVAVAGNSNSGNLAVAYGNQVDIYQYNAEAKHNKACELWELETRFDASSQVVCLDWSANDLLLTAGESIATWEKGDTGYKTAWSTRPATRVYSAKFEPNSNIFATIGQFDRLVTLWYPIGHTYDFVYLSHPRHVTHFTWRKLPPAINDRKQADCTLFTMARDGIGRFWSPVDLETPHLLYLCAVIDASQSLVTAESASDDDFMAHINHGDEFSPIYYIGCDELQSAIRGKFRCHSNHNRLDQRLMRIKDFIKDTPDLLFRIQSDGALTLWGVQHLNVLPRRVPRVFVVLRVEQAIDPVDVPYFLDQVQVLHDYSHIQASSTIKPVELSLIARNPHGQLKCYGLNLIDFIGSSPFTPRLNLKYTWLGHQKSIRSIHQTQSDRFCTTDIDGQVNVWKYELREARGRLTTELNLDSSLLLQPESLLSIPIGRGRYIATYDGHEIRVYVLNGSDCHLQNYQTCSSYDRQVPLSSLHVFTLDGDDEFLLIGMSKTKHKVLTWHLILRGNNPAEITFRGVATFTAWCEDPTSVFVSDRLSNNTMSTLLNNLGALSGQAVVMVLCAGSRVYYYSINNLAEKTSEASWNELYSLESGLETIDFIRCIVNNLAIVSHSAADKSSRLSIWMEMRTCVPPVLCQQFVFNEPIKDIAWSMSSDAQLLLAVAFPRRIAVYGQIRATGVLTESDTWASYTEFNTDTAEDVVGIVWVGCGVLAVAVGNQVRCYLKWLTPKDVLTQGPHQGQETEPMSSLYDVAYKLNGPLPLYHPRHLIHYLMWGKTEVINAVLLSLFKFLQQCVDEDDKAVQYVPPLPISKVLELQNCTTKENKKQQYNVLFGDSDLSQSDSDGEDESRTLTASEGALLMNYVKCRQLPGLTDKERMHLVAMIDTFVQISTQGESLDENGARFTALIENRHHLDEVFGHQQEEEDLKAQDMVWALHSQSQDLLLEHCTRLCNGKMTWANARSFGIFLWMQKIDVARDQMTIIARNTYLAKEDLRDPVACTLFYLALRKKTLLQSLWRATNYHNEKTAMVSFLSNDFTQPRWKTAASKNAFVLLGKQRFEYAAAFFLLADKLKDAIGVIVKHLKDYQLAIAICRVYEGDGSPLLKEVLHSIILPMAIESNDRWLVSMVYWLLGKPKESLRAVVIHLSRFSETSDTKSELDSADAVGDPTLFILHQHLKQQLFTQNRQELGIPYELEYLFSLRVAHAYERLGCPLLALYVLNQYQMAPPIEDKPERTDDFPAEKNSGSVDKNAVAPSRAADLFADVEVTSKAEDLFSSGDLFSENNPSRADDLFGEDNEATYKSANGSTERNDLFPSSSTEIAKETAVKEPDGRLASFKAILIMRMTQTVFHAAAVVLDNTMPRLESKLRNGYDCSQKGFFECGELHRIPSATLCRLLMEKSIENDSFAVYLSMIENEAPENITVFLDAFKTGCFQVFETVWMPNDTLDIRGLLFVERWTENVMSSFPIWRRLMKQSGSRDDFGLEKIIMGAYICLILTTLKLRHFEKSWTLLSQLRSFLENVANGKVDRIADTFVTLRKSEAKMVEMSSEDFESFSDDSLFGYDLNEETYRPLVDAQDASPGANLLEVASLNYTLSLLESAIQSNGKCAEMTDNLVDFIWTTMLDPIAYRTHCLKEVLSEKIDACMTKRNILKMFKTLRQKKYWHSVKSLSPAERLLPFVNFLPPEINVLTEACPPHFQTVYHTPSTTHAFCVNSISPDMLAICMKTELHEIDVSKVQRFGTPVVRARSISSKEASHDHHSDSYPDTEEDEAEILSSDTEVESLNKHPRGGRPNPRQSKSSTATVPTIQRLHVEDGTRSAQNLSIENLQDTLKRSFGMDVTRSPTGASSAGSAVEQNERMVTLKRLIPATCAEAHPQYPFYITGYEVSNGGPSAALWQFGQDHEIAKYYGCHGKVTRVHFDHFGQKFGAGDTTGGLSLWRFDSHSHSNKPYYSLTCHSKATRDFVFINSSSLLATAGTSVAMSRKRDHLCLWDTLLPPAKAMVHSFPGHENGAYAIAYEPNNQLLLSGGKRGEIVVSDIRQRTTMHTFTAHSSRVRSIALDTRNHSLITGSTSGELKIWDTSTYKLRQAFDIQPHNRFLGPSFSRITLKALGVTQIQTMDDGSVYTSGPGGVNRCSSTTE